MTPALDNDLKRMSWDTYGAIASLCAAVEGVLDHGEPVEGLRAKLCAVYDAEREEVAAMCASGTGAGQ